MRKKVTPENSNTEKDKVRTIKRKLTAEDSYFAQRDHELIEKHSRERQKKEQTTEVHSNQKNSIKHCLDCGTSLEEFKINKTIVDKCPDCGGVWLQSKDMQRIIKKQANLFESMIELFSPKEK